MTPTEKKRIIFGIGLVVILVAVVIIFYPGALRLRTKPEPRFEEREVIGESLVPIIQPGEVVKIDKEYYQEHEIAIGDIIAFTFPSKTSPIIKIVEALAGDRFHLAKAQDGNWQIFINGAVVKNLQGIPYSFSTNAINMLSIYERDYKGLVPNGALLVLGNETAGSFDSTAFGLLSVKNIIGRIVR